MIKYVTPWVRQNWTLAANVSSHSLCMSRSSMSSANTNFFLTTPIFYVNARPHLGHAYTAVLADAQARFRRLRGQVVHLLSGTDEHGFKVERAAAAAGQMPKRFCSDVARQYMATFDLLGVAADDFVRTTEERHAQTVRWLWRRLSHAGHLSKANYGGWYCVPDETFLTETQTEVRTLANGHLQRVSLESGHPVEWEEEENYVFNLAAFKPAIRQWLDRDKNVILPTLFRGFVESALGSDSLDLLSVSRPSRRCQWGVTVPDDETQVVYVWLDALANYLTTVRRAEGDSLERWPPDVHLVGKDILKFHAVYWPAFLMAADLDLPRCIRVHSHWMVDNEKMSKSKGNVVDPVALADRYTGQGVRYFLLREGVPHSDGNFNERKMSNYLNAELANTLGNLLNRCTAKTLLEARAGVVGDCVLSTQQAQTLLSEVSSLPQSVATAYESFEYYKGIDAIMAVLRSANAYINDEKPWELKKDQPERLDEVLRVSLESLRVCGILLQPIVPQLAETLLDKLGVKERSWVNAEKNELSFALERLASHKCVLFQRVKSAKGG